MLVDTSHDLIVFLCTFACGQLIGAVLDVFRAMRKVFFFGKKAVALQDIAFCAMAFALFSHTVNISNSGDIRWYEFAGLILGVVIYFSLESPFVMKILVGMWQALKLILARIGAFLHRAKAFLAKPFLILKNKIGAMKAKKSKALAEKTKQK